MVLNLETMGIAARHIAAFRMIARHTNPSLNVLGNGQSVKNPPGIRRHTAFQIDGP
jgi:hypothetical protein